MGISKEELENRRNTLTQNLEMYIQSRSQLQNQLIKTENDMEQLRGALTLVESLLSTLQTEGSETETVETEAVNTVEEA